MEVVVVENIIQSNNKSKVYADNMKRFIDNNIKIVTINWYKEIPNHPL